MPKYVFCYKPTRPIMGKRGRYLKWHPYSKAMILQSDAIALHQARLCQPQDGILAKVHEVVYGSNGKCIATRAVFVLNDHQF